MASFTPIMLSGDNLGQRHRCLNTLVSEAIESGTTIRDMEALSLESPVDRLFKIDLAIRLKHVDYIIRNLKDDDMLYVSRALKSTWLIDHRDIINSKYLEDVLFPEMIMPAVTKMKNWLYINLRDPGMSQEFYQHYKENTFELAIKFLSHCSHEFILAETPKISTKLSTHSLKVLCEKCPRVAKIYFESVVTDEDVKTRYLGQEQAYYNSVKCVLKSDADVFLDITEKYFNLNSFSRFSPLATDYVLRCHKSRFTNKLELYVAYFLNIPTLAARLSVEECQEVVLKLARASYLQHWFQYKVVEPLIKRLRPDKRAGFKKLVFVEKDVGERVQEWPYPTPKSPPNSNSDPYIFDDEDFLGPISICEGQDFRCMLKKKRYSRFDKLITDSCVAVKSDLDRLFDEFRFTGFDRALHDLGQRLRAAGSADRRRDIFLVLVSKSGGRSDAVSALLCLAARHSNEPAHTRASILRSLVKRANVWRLSANVWQHFLDFGHGLGLDGAPSEAACLEGLHCVVIRQLLVGECEQAVRDAFLNEFSTLAEYSLKVDERVRVAYGLQNMLAAAARHVEPAVIAERLHQLVDVIRIYHVEKVSPTVEAVKSLALRDAEVARSLLERLYFARIGRRELLRVNLKFRCDQGALMNALRHDPPALEFEKVADILATGQSQFDAFVSKLVIYFNQKEDFTIQLRSALKEKIAQQQNENCKNVLLARPLASLLCQDFERELRELDAAGKESVKFAAALRACAHRARPVVNVAEWGWRKAGVKAVATRAIRCREIERDELTRTLAAERRTVRVALAVSMRSANGLLLDTFQSAAKLRPMVALRVALPYFRHQDASADPGVWDIVKPLFSSVDFSSRYKLSQLLRKTEWIPSKIKPDYCGTLYVVLEKISKSGSDFVLRDLCMLLPEVSEDMIENILLWMLDDEPKIHYPAIFVRYLMLSRNHKDSEKRFTKVGDRFMEILENLRCEGESNFQQRLDQIMKSLKYNAAFLDNKYTSCLSVIERILDWTKTFMPKEEYFEKYVHIHLTMLYFKAVRQSMKQMPEVFADPKKRNSEGVEAVGFVFGRYIVKEVAELVSTYFDSIIELYTGALSEYLRDNLSYGSSKAKLIGSVLKGILAEAVGTQRRMAVYILRDFRYDVKDFMRNEIEELMEQDKCIELFVHAEVLN